MKLDVPHLKQGLPYTCLPARIRMVLAYWGKEHSEEELASISGTTPVWGTNPGGAVEGLERLGYHALWFENATLERLLDLLDIGWPVIVFLRAADLPHGRAGLHAVVVVGMEDNEIIYLDPQLDFETRLELSRFLRAWASLGQQGLAV